MSAFLFVDTETTSLDTKKGAIIEIACIPVIDGIVLDDTFHSYIRPHEDAKIDPRAMVVNKIDPKKFHTFPPQKEVITDLIKFVESFDQRFIMAGHGVKFDKDFLYLTFCRNGEVSTWYKLFRANTHCTLEIARKKKKSIKTKSLSLGSLCQYFNIKLENAHNALADITATVELSSTLEGVGHESQQSSEQGPKSRKELEAKYLNSKYIQFNHNGDIYISSYCTTNKEAFSFIIEELIERYK